MEFTKNDILIILNALDNFEIYLHKALSVGDYETIEDKKDLQNDLFNSQDLQEKFHNYYRNHFKS